MGVGFISAGFLALVVISLGSAWGVLEALHTRSRRSFLIIYTVESLPAILVVMMLYQLCHVDARTDGDIHDHSPSFALFAWKARITAGRDERAPLQQTMANDVLGDDHVHCNRWTARFGITAQGRFHPLVDKTNLKIGFSCLHIERSHRNITGPFRPNCVAFDLWEMIVRSFFQMYLGPNRYSMSYYDQDVYAAPGQIDVLSPTGRTT